MKQTKFRFSKQGLFISWMSSYAFILAIPLFISTLVYFQSGNIVRNEINRANIALLTQVQQAMDSRVKETERFGLQIALSPLLKGLMYATELTDYNRQTMMQLQKDLELYRSVNSYISDFYLYLPNSGKVLNYSGMYDDPAFFYEQSGGLGGLSYLEWSDLMNRKQVGEYMIFGGQEASETAPKMITTGYSLPLEDPSRVNAKLMIILDERMFRQEVEQVQWVNQGTVLILDGNDRVLATSSGSNPVKGPFATGSLPDSGNIASMEVNGEKVTVSYVSSSVNNWKYVSMLPSSVFLEKARYIRNLTLVSLAVCLIGGVIVAYYFARRNYYPVRELIDLLSRKGKINFEESKNEYEFIKGVVAHTFEEKEEINRKLERQHFTMRVNFIKRLLNGRLERNFPVDEALTTYNMKFHTDRFAVILFYIEDYSYLFTDSNTQDVEEKLKFVHLIIKNIVEELANQQHCGYMEEVDGMLACLVNFKENTSEPHDALLHILHEAKKYVQDRFHILFTASVSSIHQGLDGIAAAFQEAMDAMEYKIVTGSSHIIHYEDIAAPQLEHKFYYPIELEQQLINFIKAGQLERARTALQDLFDRNMSGGPVSIDLAKCLMFTMIGTMLKTLDDIPQSEEAFMNKNQPVSRLFACESIPEMKVVILDILQQLCHYMEMNKKSHNTDLRDQVLAYISEHYHDVNLNISAIAEQFDVHSSYLSHFFKEQTGGSMLDAINKTRISRAKELLREGYNIGDTAVQAGFYNSNAFIRVFKKYEGVTPGQYKSTI
jgi:two-component system, response regulator YesN